MSMVNRFNPAEFNQVINLYKTTFTQNDFGIPVEQTELICKIKARISNVKGMDSFIGDSVVYCEDLKVTIRWSRSLIALDSNTTIEFNGSIYDVISFNNIKQANVYFEMVMRKRI